MLIEAKERSGNLDERLSLWKEKGNPTELINPEIITELKKLKPETISALSDSQIKAICANGCNNESFENTIKALPSLETEFTPDELRIISIKDYQNDLAQWLSELDTAKEEAFNNLKNIAKL